MLTVTVDELIYSLAEGATGTFFDIDMLHRESDGHARRRSRSPS